ncbi:hypothetical protein MP478_03360 [Chryseobacterium sp. WG14]|uniref:hypothetical protein n=1 Tax=unclassified Chryseobacterium TaxID=2593645 RepID=UPI001D524838|nr:MULTISPECIES: hypothetical protein [unclassified Chryseobacterium]MCQ9636212.1 hypothetical protein [Chryseobacterium sp. WG23]MCQ9638413.1 hypothetical protein [Chryseobacterium sp. WG14]CAH0162927.1 hypothetical protein SRABI04_01057 [Chryseobacterium sp. Bi04]
MKTKTFQLICIFIVIFQYAQIGILTKDPKAALDVNGNTVIRQVPQTNTLPGYQFLLMNQSNSEVSQISPGNINFSDTLNPSVYAAKKASGISLLSLGIFPSGFRSVNFTTTEKTTGNPTLFSDAESAYTAPSNGVYLIGYTFRYGTGLQASLLADTPGIGIVLTRANTATILDSRVFSGINLSILLSVTISESTINSLYTLQAGDKISFGLIGSGLLDVGLLGSSTSSFYIYKVSN